MSRYMYIACLFNDHFIWRSRFIFMCIFSVTCYRFNGAKIVLHTTSCMEDWNILLTITNKGSTKYTCRQFAYHHHHHLLHVEALSWSLSGRNQTEEEKHIKPYCVMSFENSGRVCIKHSSKLHIHNMNSD